MPKNEESNLNIDIYSLDKECAEQPQKMADAGMVYARAQYVYLGAKLNRDERIALVSTDARQNPQRYGLEKITDKSVSGAVTINDDVMKAEKDVINANLLMEQAKASRDAWMQRSSLLKCEVDLWLSNYYANSSNQKSSDKDKKIKERKKAIQ